MINDTYYSTYFVLSIHSGLTKKKDKWKKMSELNEDIYKYIAVKLIKKK